jgi:hypothetical protein
MTSIIQRLPIGYTEIEYLSTTGQQSNQTSTNAAAWIDTGIVPGAKTSMECRMRFTSLPASGSESLCGTTGSGRFAWGFANVNPQTVFYVGLGNQNVATSVTRDTDWHVFRIDAYSKTWAIDNVTGSFTSAGTLNATISIDLFARNNSSVGSSVCNKPANADIDYCKFWNDGVLIRDYVSCNRDTDGVKGLYDMENDVFYTSKGTKVFTGGSAFSAEKMRLIYKTDNNGAKLVIPVFPQTANTKPMKLVYFPK